MTRTIQERCHTDGLGKMQACSPIGFKITCLQERGEGRRPPRPHGPSPQGAESAYTGSPLMTSSSLSPSVSEQRRRSREPARLPMSPALEPASPDETMGSQRLWLLAGSASGSPGEHRKGGGGCGESTSSWAWLELRPLTPGTVPSRWHLGMTHLRPVLES